MASGLLCQPPGAEALWEEAGGVPSGSSWEPTGELAVLDSLEQDPWPLPRLASKPAPALKVVLGGQRFLPGPPHTAHTV